MPGLVDITLPDGQAASVPEENLALALSSGARVDGPMPGSEPDRGGGLLGQAATAALGAGRTASMGFSDFAIGEMANIVGGEQARKDTIKSIDIARNANPYSNMAGEFAGLFIGGPSSIGEGVEGAITEKIGEGLTSRVVGMAARGGVEGAMMGYQHEISEATLGDHDVNGEKLFASVGKDALLGTAIGVPMGFVSHGVATAIEKVRGLRGPTSGAILDEVAGVEGAGKYLLDDARSAEALVEKLQRSGATSEQAAKMADDVMTMTRARTNAGPLSGLLDEAALGYASRRAGANATMGETLAEAYAQRAQKLADRASVLDEHALNLKKIGDRVMRAEDALNEVQFKYKAEQMAKLVDPARFGAQRDTLAKLLQDSDDVLRFWESTAAKGGAEGSIKSLRKQWTDALDTLAKVEETGGAAASRDFFIKADKFKRAIDSYAQFGKSPYGLPEAVLHAEMGLRPLGDKWRYALEDAEVWGNAGLAQKEWNATFSQTFARRQDFGSRFAARIDEVRGIPVPEMDAEKVKNALLKKLGSEADSQQALKSVEAWMNGNRDRIAAIKKYGDLVPSEMAALEDGAKALGEFEGVLGSARKESEVIARIEKMQLEEQGKALGGIMGLGADLVTRPMTTMERLGALRVATRKVEDAIESGMKRFFGGKAGPDVIDELAQKIRPKADVANDVAEIRTLAANPSALEARATEMVGDMTKYAPKTAESAKNAFKRAVFFLANEAPQASVSLALVASHKPEPRYSEQQLHEWDAKKRAAFDPKTVVFDMKSGRMNRDAIRTIEFVSPKLYLEIQRSAQDWIEKLAAEGKLDKMPRAQQAALASLLKVPADETWRPDFLLMMQAAKSTQAAPKGPAGGPPPSAAPAMVTSKRAIKLNAGVFETEAYAIEKR